MERGRVAVALWVRVVWRTSSCVGPRGLTRGRDEDGAVVGGFAGVEGEVDKRDGQAEGGGVTV